MADRVVKRNSRAEKVLLFLFRYHRLIASILLLPENERRFASFPIELTRKYIIIGTRIRDGVLGNSNYNQKRDAEVNKPLSFLFRMGLIDVYHNAHIKDYDKKVIVHFLTDKGLKLANEIAKEYESMPVSCTIGDKNIILEKWKDVYQIINTTMTSIDRNLYPEQFARFQKVFNKESIDIVKLNQIGVDNNIHDFCELFYFLFPQKDPYRTPPTSSAEILRDIQSKIIQSINTDGLESLLISGKNSEDIDLLFRCSAKYCDVADIDFQVLSISDTNEKGLFTNSVRIEFDIDVCEIHPSPAYVDFFDAINQLRPTVQVLMIKDLDRIPSADIPDILKLIYTLHSSQRNILLIGFYCGNINYELDELIQFAQKHEMASHIELLSMRKYDRLIIEISHGISHHIEHIRQYLVETGHLQSNDLIWNHDELIHAIPTSFVEILNHRMALLTEEEVQFLNHVALSGSHLMTNIMRFLFDDYDSIVESLTSKNFIIQTPSDDERIFVQFCEPDIHRMVSLKVHEKIREQIRERIKKRLENLVSDDDLEL